MSDAGDIAGACAKFRESDRLDPAVGTTFNLADCEERLGRLARAWTLFDEVAQRLPASDKRRSVAHARARALEPRLPKLSIRQAPNVPPGTRILRDGVELGAASLGTPLPVDPGEHAVLVSAPGRAERSFKVLISEREIQVLDVDVGPPLTVPSSAKAATLADHGPASQRAAPPVLGYVLGGVGALGLVTGAVSGVLVLRKKGRVDAHCDAEKRCDDEGLSATKSGKTLGIVTTMGLVTGVVGVGAGAYLVFSSTPSGAARNASVTLRARF